MGRIIKTKSKRTVHKHYNLVDKIVSCGDTTILKALYTYTGLNNQAIMGAGFSTVALGSYRYGREGGYNYLCNNYLLLEIW